MHAGLPVFENGQFDGIVHLGNVGIDTLLNSILYDVTLYDFVQHEFVDIFDFDNIDLTEAEITGSGLSAVVLNAIETAFSIDFEDAIDDTIGLYSLVAMNIPGA